MMPWIPKRVRTPAIGVLATLALIAASAYLGWVFERVARPNERSDSEFDGPGDLTRPEVQEIEDRVVQRVRSGASTRAIDSALKPLRAVGMTEVVTPEAIIERRAAWWRSRLAHMHPTQRALATERPRTIGFSDDELDLLPRTPERERALLDRIVDPAVRGDEAVSWADTLSRGPLTPETALHAIAKLPAADPALRGAVALALRGTKAARVLSAWLSLAADPGQDLALRTLAARNSIGEDPDGQHLQRALALLLDAAQPVEVRSALLVEIRPWRLADDPRVRQALRTLAADTAAPLQLRVGVVAWLGVAPRTASTDDDRIVLAAIRSSPSEPDALRKDAADAMTRLGAPP